LRRNHQHDFTLAETPSATEFSAGESLASQVIDGSRMDLQQGRDLGRGENFFHRPFPLYIIRGYHFLNRQQCCQQISDSAAMSAFMLVLIFSLIVASIS
jgi:hypothetical protein